MMNSAKISAKPLLYNVAMVSLLLALVVGLNLVVFDIASADSLPKGSAMTDVKATIEQIVSTVQAIPGDSNSAKRRAKLREIINPRFDFDEMSKRCLGPNWNTITPDQQNEFIKLFSNLLAKTYLNRIETVKPGMVKIEGEDTMAANPSDPNQKAVVKTSVNNNGEVFPIHYRVINRNGTWKVYDVVIENIGLVANYRSEFSGIIRKDKIDGLLEKLRQKQNA